jgi:hypothetical protein
MVKAVHPRGYEQPAANPTIIRGQVGMAEIHVETRKDAKSGVNRHHYECHATQGRLRGGRIAQQHRGDEQKRFFHSFCQHCAALRGKNRHAVRGMMKLMQRPESRDRVFESVHPVGEE